MKNILIKPVEGHKINGEGETLGTDYEGTVYTYWRSAGEVEVPIELALKLEQEFPQRFEVRDKKYIKFVEKLFKNIEIKVIEEKKLEKVIEPMTIKEPVIEPVKKKPEEEITLKMIKSMTKDEINDFGAKRDYDVDTKDRKAVMIKKLVKQIEKRTGKKVI